MDNAVDFIHKIKVCLPLLLISAIGGSPSCVLRFHRDFEAARQVGNQHVPNEPNYSRLDEALSSSLRAVQEVPS